MRNLIERLSFRTLIYVAAVFVLLAGAAIGLTVWQLRTDAIEAAAKDAGNVAVVLAEQMDSSIQAVDRALQEIRARVTDLNTDSEDEFRQLTSSQYMHLLLKRRLEALPQADVVFLVDSSGKALSGSKTFPISLDLSDRDYYQYYKNFGNENIYISNSSVNRQNGASTLFFSKRIDGPNNAFYGVVVIGVQTGYFRHVYNSISTLADRSFFLARSDGTILIRHPESSEPAAERIPRTSSWHGIAVRGGGYYSDTDRTGRPWLISVRPIGSAPLIVNVGITEQAALALWRDRASFIGIGSAFALMCLGVLFWALSGQFSRLHRSEAQLSQQKGALAEQSRALELANVQIDAALNNMSQGLSMFDSIGRLVLCNNLYMRMFGLTEQDMRPGVTFLDLLHHREQNGGGLRGDPEALFAKLTSELKAGKDVKGTMRLDDGRIISVINRPMPGGGWVATHDDITQSKQAEAQIAYMARHDMLTGLPNRLLLTESLDGALERLRANGERFSVFIFDLDRFKEVNDSLGHPIGDALLEAVARRLQTCARHEIDTVARLGGDEFAILQPVGAVDQREVAVVLASHLLRAVSAPYEIEGHEITIGASIGIAMAPRDGADVSELLKHADLALYKVKMEGRDGFDFFESEMDDAARTRGELQIDLRKALPNREFELFYQPIARVADCRIRGFEALLRWHHPQRGMISPDQFIPLAEETGLIVPIGDWVLREACEHAATWPPQFRLSVNLSSVQFSKGCLIDLVSNALMMSGLAPERLDLEITETALLQEHYDVVTVMHQLRSLGVQLVLDDFGTGYSSLSNLQKFPFDKIKIDKSFVDNLATRTESAAIVSSVVGLGKALNIIVTAEGVETEEQLTLLRAAGCDEAQGYLLGRPVPVSQLVFDPAHSSRVA